MDDMFDQLVKNLKQLGALDHGLSEQADFDKSSRVPNWSMDSHKLHFKLQFDECVVEFPIQWRNNPRLLVTEFMGTYNFLAHTIWMERGKLTEINPSKSGKRLRLGYDFDEDQARSVGGLIRMDLQDFKCDDGFIAQQRLITKPKESMRITKPMVHIGMKTLMETMKMAVAKPPVISTQIAFAGENLERFQRLEWPKLLRNSGNIIMANGQKVKIQMCRLVVSPAARQRHREQAREIFASTAQEVGIPLNADRDLAWAVLDELAQEVYQADIRPASEIPADEVVVEDDVIIELDSGLSSSRITPTSPPRTTVVSPMMMPVPSARPPTPPVPPPAPEPQERPTTQRLREAFMEQMKEQTEIVKEYRTMFQETKQTMLAMKAEINALKAQVRLEHCGHMTKTLTL